MKLYIIIVLVICVLVAVVFVSVFMLCRKKSTNPLIKMVEIGMSEQELVQKCGAPKQTIIIDENTKMVIYKKRRKLIARSYWFDDGVCFELKITLKDGIVTNITE